MFIYAQYSKEGQAWQQSKDGGKQEAHQADIYIERYCKSNSSNFCLTYPHTSEVMMPIDTTANEMVPTAIASIVLPLELHDKIADNLIDCLALKTLLNYSLTCKKYNSFFKAKRKRVLSTNIVLKSDLQVLSMMSVLERSKADFLERWTNVKKVTFAGFPTRENQKRFLDAIENQDIYSLTSFGTQLQFEKQFYMDAREKCQPLRGVTDLVKFLSVFTPYEDTESEQEVCFRPSLKNNIAISNYSTRALSYWACGMKTYFHEPCPPGGFNFECSTIFVTHQGLLTVAVKEGLSVESMSARKQMFEIITSNMLNDIPLPGHPLGPYKFQTSDMDQTRAEGARSVTIVMHDSPDSWVEEMTETMQKEIQQGVSGKRAASNETSNTTWIRVLTGKESLVCPVCKSL